MLHEATLDDIYEASQATQGYMRLQWVTSG